MPKMYTVKKKGSSYIVLKNGVEFQDGLTKTNADNMAKAYNVLYANKKKQFGLI